MTAVLDRGLRLLPQPMRRVPVRNEAGIYVADLFHLYDTFRRDTFVTLMEKEKKKERDGGAEEAASSASVHSKTPNKSSVVEKAGNKEEKEIEGGSEAGISVGFEEALQWARGCCGLLVEAQRGDAADGNSSALLCERFAELVEMLESARTRWEQEQAKQQQAGGDDGSRDTSLSSESNAKCPTPPPRHNNTNTTPKSASQSTSGPGARISPLQPLALPTQPTHSMANPPQPHLASIFSPQLGVASPLGELFQIYDAPPPPPESPASPSKAIESSQRSDGTLSRKSTSSWNTGTLGSSGRSSNTSSAGAKEKAIFRVSMAELTALTPLKTGQPSGGPKSNERGEGSEPISVPGRAPRVRWLTSDEGDGRSADALRFPDGDGDALASAETVIVDKPSAAQRVLKRSLAQQSGSQGGNPIATRNPLEDTILDSDGESSHPHAASVTLPVSGQVARTGPALEESPRLKESMSAIGRRLPGAQSQGATPPYLSRNNTSAEFAAYLMASLRKVPTLEGTLVELDTGFTVIADFEVVAELGRGTYGTVSLGVDTEGEMFAIKTLHNGTRIARSASKKSAGQGVISPGSSVNPAPPAPGARGGEVAREAEVTPASPGIVQVLSSAEVEETAVEREIAVMKRLNHPNVVKLHAVIEDAKENQTHLVMQYIENGPLTKINRDGTCKALPVPLALHYMTQVSSGLDYLHHCGIIHRDVKPENILTDKEYTAYVADFGVSSILADKRGVALTSRAGTMAFMAPELIASPSAAAEFGKEADIWAFGVSVYCMVFGKLPFYGRTIPELVKAISYEPLRFPDSLPPVTQRGTGDDAWLIPEGEKEECYRNVCTLIERLLVKDPKGRMSLRAFRRYPYVQKYALSSPNMQSETSWSGTSSDYDSSTHDEDITTRHPSATAEEAPLVLPTAPPKQHTTKTDANGKPIVNPRHVRESVTDDEVRSAVSRCNVGMYRKQSAASLDTQSLVSRFVSRFRARLRPPVLNSGE